MVQRRQRAQLVVGRLRVQAARQQHSAGKRVRAVFAAARQLGLPKLLSKAALCATMGLPATKRAASRITCSAGGAAYTISLVMPVSWVMKLFTRTPAFIRLW